MAEGITNNKRVIKNTLLLSVRMILVMLVSLYTVRVVLRSLGVVDYGLNNVIGGTVMLFKFLSNTMAQASQRFFSYEIGRDNESGLRKMFQTNMTIYLGIALIVFVVSATLGMWFVNYKMVIPEQRIVAANWIFVFSALSFVMRLFATPYQAVLIAREKMNLFAWLSVGEATGLLLIAFLLDKIPSDKLIAYGVFVFILNLIICSSYAIICRIRFSECRFGINKDKSQLKKLIGYTGWSLYGNSASIMKNNGVNILLNLFFGPTVNAARGVAYNAYNAIYNLVTNFSVALNPQIVKNYAAGETGQMMTLVFRGSKICYYIMLFLTLPVLLQTSYIFTLWLDEIPQYTVVFTKLILVMAVIDAIGMPVTAAIDATGRIKRYQLVVGSVQFAIIPISYVCLELGGSPYSPMLVSIVVSVAALMLKVFLAHKSYNLSVIGYIQKVILRIIPVTMVSYTVSMLFMSLYGGDRNLWDFVTISAVCTGSVAATVYSFGIDNTERTAIKAFVMKKLRLKTVARQEHM